MTFDEWRNTQALPPDLADWPSQFESVMRHTWQAATTAAFERAAEICEEEAAAMQEQRDNAISNKTIGGRVVRVAGLIEAFSKERKAAAEVYQSAAEAIRAEAAKETK